MHTLALQLLKKKPSNNYHPQPQVTIFLDTERDEFREELYLSWSFCTTAIWVIEVTLEAIF